MMAAKTTAVRSAAPEINGGSRLAWLEDVAAALTYAAKTPTFPGDPSLVPPLLDKLVTKLYSECHNGKEVGTDGCPTCRAWRTEKAEADAKAARVQLDSTSASLEAERRKTATLSNDLADARGAAEDAIRGRDGWKRINEIAERATVSAVRDRDGALAETAELRKHVADLTVKLATATTGYTELATRHGSLVDALLNLLPKKETT